MANLRARLTGSARTGAGRLLSGAGLQRRIDIPDDVDPAFVPLFRRCREFTMCSVERQYALYTAMCHLAAAGIEGDFVECGVWRGGSAMLAGLTAAQCGDDTRHFTLYDVFGAFPPPSERDGSYEWAVWRGIDRTGVMSGHPIPTEAEVRQNLLAAGLPESRLSLVKGRVEDTIPAHAPAAIALLRLDTDWFDSTLHELNHLYPRVAPGGVVIIDDYGCMEGARRATDEYFGQLERPPLLTRLDTTGRLAIKPG